ncbi:MAG: helix-turn-helix transcriptional regulator [Eubacterium sp.]|nr:helix-turn-helix transcriptional regulator [Eubacterium sp.]
MERKSIGQFIAALRKANGLTQKQLADKLNVSDKAVSRWERDECAPDISLIPVIADIFGVTCDELLCGERKINNENSTVSDDVLSAKGEKQRRRILAVGLSQYRNRSLIAVGIALAGLIAAAICNFAFFRANLGFMIGVIFFIAAVICQAIFLNKALLSVTDDEFSDDETGVFKKKIITLAEFVIGFAVTLSVFTLPLNFTEGEVYVGIDLNTWLRFGLFMALLAALISYTIAIAVNARLTKKGVWTPTKEEKVHRHNYILLVLCMLSMIVTSGFGYFIYSAVTENGFAPKFAEGTVFNDYESFAEFMEKDVPYPDPKPDGFYPSDPDDYGYSYNEEYIYTDSIAEELDGTDDEFDENDEYYDPYQDFFIGSDDYGFVDSGERIVIKDANRKILLDCEYNNHSVIYIECGTEDNGWLPIKVVTYDDLPEGERVLQYIKYVVYAVVFGEAIFAVYVFYKKREAIGK